MASSESNGNGVRLSKAVVFVPGRVPVVARFALAGSEPYVHDAFGIVRSMVLLFLLRDGEQSDLQQRLPKWQCTR